MIENSKLIELYDNQYIRSLIQIIPFAPSVDVFLREGIDKYRSKRLRAFFDDIASQKITLTNEIINNDDFLYCYFATVRSVLNTRRQEKITFFARLFGAVVSFEKLKSLDDFESYLNKLDGLSLREIQILKLLYDFEIGNGLKQTDHIITRLERNEKFWNEFLGEAAKEVSAPKEEVQDMLIVAERSGCYTKCQSKLFLC